MPHLKQIVEERSIFYPNPHFFEYTKFFLPKDVTESIYYYLYRRSHSKGICVLRITVRSFLLYALQSCIIKEQRGFYRGCSTLSNSLVFTNFVISALEQGQSVDRSHTDLSKALDNVNICRFLRKLTL